MRIYGSFRAVAGAVEIIHSCASGEAVPSIESAKKIADAFGVSLDYLVGEGVNSKFDKKTVTRLLDIEKLDPTDKEHVFAMLDTLLFLPKINY